MPTFAFEAMNSSGQEVKDEIDAASSEEAIKKIRSKGFFPTKVKEKADAKTKARFFILQSTANETGHRTCGSFHGDR